MFPDYILSDHLLKEEIRVYTQMYGSCFPSCVPSFTDNIFESRFYLVFKIVLQQIKFVISDDSVIESINNGLKLDIHKCNNVIQNMF